MPDVLATSDACLVHLSKAELFETVIPSKIFETMAMRRPIIMGVRGPAREIVNAAGGGVDLEPENDEQLCEILYKLSDDPEWTEQLGQRARRYVIEHFNRDDLAERYRHVLLRVAEGKPVTEPGSCRAAGITRSNSPRA